MTHSDLYFPAFVLVIGLFSCSTNVDSTVKQMTTDHLQANPSPGNALRDINLADSVRYLMDISAAKDTFQYTAYYNADRPYRLLYFKAGNLFTSGARHAVALYSSSDTIIVCELYSLINGQWTSTGSNIAMHIYAFSPAFFNVWLDDYNFDGYKDLKIDFYQSMGEAYTYGYILTFNQPGNTLTLHPGTIEIPDLDIDAKSKTLVSTVYSNPHTDPEKFKEISKYSWKNGTLRLLSKQQYKLQ